MFGVLNITRQPFSMDQAEKWLEVTDDAGHGLRFEAEDVPFESSVLPYSCYELPKAHYTWVRIMGCQMGIGGDDSWGAPVQRQFWLESNVDRKLTFTIRKV